MQHVYFYDKPRGGAQKENREKENALREKDRSRKKDKINVNDNLLETGLSQESKSAKTRLWSSQCIF